MNRQTRINLVCLVVGVVAFQLIVRLLIALDGGS